MALVACIVENSRNIEHLKCYTLGGALAEEIIGRSDADGIKHKEAYLSNVLVHVEATVLSTATVSYLAKGLLGCLQFC